MHIKSRPLLYLFISLCVIMVVPLVPVPASATQCKTALKKTKTASAELCRKCVGLKKGFSLKAGNNCVFCPFGDSRDKVEGFNEPRNLCVGNVNTCGPVLNQATSDAFMKKALTTEEQCRWVDYWGLEPSLTDIIKAIPVCGKLAMDETLLTKLGVNRVAEAIVQTIPDRCPRKGVRCSTLSKDRIGKSKWYRDVKHSGAKKPPKGKILIAIKGEYLKSIIDSGVMNMFQTNSATYGGGSGRYLANRIGVEKDMACMEIGHGDTSCNGKPEDVAKIGSCETKATVAESKLHQLRAKSAFFIPDEKDLNEHIFIPQNYGNIFVELDRRKLAKRTTLTIGDSLNYWGANAGEHFQRPHRFRTESLADIQDSDFRASVSMGKLLPLGPKKTLEYYEAQIYGTITLHEDATAILIRKNVYVKNPKKFEIFEKEFKQYPRAATCKVSRLDDGQIEISRTNEDNCTDVMKVLLKNSYATENVDPKQLQRLKDYNTHRISSSLTQLPLFSFPATADLPSRGEPL